MYVGVDYYPEHWTEDRWPIDAQMMREANINLVRLAEFAWSKLEPEDGQFDFSWLDRSIDILVGAGIKIVLGTPTAAAPKWLMDKYPDMYPVDVYGLTKGFGTRRHYCVNHPVYREYSKRIAHEMAKHYKDNPHIVAWQIDNEFGGGCYCDSCLKGFRLWLRGKYGTIGQLNQEWGTVFWSHTYRHFDEIPLPVYAASDGFSQSGASSFLSTPFNHNPGMVLDYFRFFSDATVDYQKLQMNEIRKTTDLPITHNYMGHFSELDYFDLGKDLDFISWDCYPNHMWSKSSYTNIAMAHDLTRGVKNQNFWVMEQQSGPCGWHMMGDTPEPGQIRLWTYQAIAHGAEAIVYFRWRACTVGIEQYWHGILDHDGIGRRRYREVQGIGAEIEQLSELFVGAENVTDVALIKSYDNVWSHRGQPHNSKFNYNGLLEAYYAGLAAHHVQMDVTSVDCDFSKYKLVLMPAFNLMNEEIAEKCKVYVAAGGALLITFRSGTKTWNNQMTTITVPGLFKDIAGVELEEFDSINHGRTVQVKGEFGEGTATTWCDVLKLTSAETLATYDSHYYAGEPAVTVNAYGQGHVYYVGCDLDQLAMERLAKLIIDRERIETAAAAPIPGVEVVKRRVNGQAYTMLLNHNNTAVEVPLTGAYRDALAGSSVSGTVQVGPYDVSVLQEE
jgi:beta-galactosidase